MADLVAGLTLVLQDSVPALEVLNQDGKWVNADPVPGTLVCNVGQYLERNSNGIFQATVHRVRNKTGQVSKLPEQICSAGIIKKSILRGLDPKTSLYHAASYNDVLKSKFEKSTTQL